MTNSDDLELPVVNNSMDIFQESIMHIKRDTLQMKDCPPYTYYTLKTHPFAVIILASNKEGKFVLINEYRHPTRKYLLSCPAGYVETNEDLLIAAQRELLEETGFEAESFEIMGSAYPYAGISGQKNIYVRAFHASYKKPPQLEKSEIIVPIFLSEMEIHQEFEKQSPLDANLLTALWFNRLRKSQDLRNNYEEPKC